VTLPGGSRFAIALVVTQAQLPLIVTISRQLASGGAYVGQRLAARLGFRYLDREILKQAAAALGFDDEQPLEAMEERASGFWRRLSRSVAIGAPDAPFVPPPPPSVDEAAVVEIETRIIREVAAQEPAVIVGRGAAHLLADRERVIRVFIHAPKEQRVMEAARVYSLDSAEARDMVTRSDRNRARFVQSLVGRSWTDACLYDLTFDTSVIPHDTVVDLLVMAVNAQPPPRHDPLSDAS
jgi:cytidylate kinase